MASKNTYVIFDADNDRWAYAHIKGWNALKNIDFTFDDAHDEYKLTNKAEDESYIKGILRKRFETTKQAVLLIGESTKNLYKYVRWELEVAQELDMPIIAVNLNGKRKQDNSLCPAIIRDAYVVHIPFQLKILKYALENFPNEFSNRATTDTGPRYYSDAVYQSLGLND